MGTNRVRRTRGRGLMRGQAGGTWDTTVLVRWQSLAPRTIRRVLQEAAMQQLVLAGSRRTLKRGPAGRVRVQPGRRAKVGLVAGDELGPATAEAMIAAGLAASEGSLREDEGEFTAGI